MTPRERAEKVKMKIGMNGAARSEINGEMARWIEEAITAAVEEEREACAQIAEAFRQNEHDLFAKYKESSGPCHIIAELIRNAIIKRKGIDQ